MSWLSQIQVSHCLRQQLVRYVLALLVLPWLAACSTVKFTYNQGPTLSYWWLDSYVDFSADQSSLAKAELEAWFKWHRSTQLGSYVEFLSRLAQQSSQAITPKQLCQAREEIELRMLEGFDQAVPAMARVISSFKPEQFDHLAARYAKGDRTVEEDYLNQPREKWQSKSQDRWLENLETFYGPVTEAQRQQLKTAIGDLPFDPRLWLAERRTRHAEIVSGLRRLHQERAELSQYEAALRAFATMTLDSPREDYRRYRSKVASAQCTLMALLHNQATPQQRQNAASKLLSYADDLRTLQQSAP